MHKSFGKEDEEQSYEYAARKSNKRIIFSVKITFICKYAYKVIICNCNEIDPGENLLRFDLQYAMPHCFENHENCRSEVCTDARQMNKDSVYPLLSSGMKIELCSVMYLLITYNFAVNRPEEYKHTRCYDAFYQCGAEWTYKTREVNNHRSPGKHTKNIINKHEDSRVQLSLIRCKKGKHN